MEYGYVEGEKHVVGYISIIASSYRHNTGVIALVKIRMKSFYHRMNYNRSFWPFGGF